MFFATHYRAPLSPEGGTIQNVHLRDRACMIHTPPQGVGGAVYVAFSNILETVSTDFT